MRCRGLSGMWCGGIGWDDIELESLDVGEWASVDGSCIPAPRLALIGAYSAIQAMYDEPDATMRTQIQQQAR